MMKELEQAIEVLIKLRVDAFKHNQDGLEKSLYELEQMIFKAQDSLQPKGKTKEEVWEEVQSYHQIEGMVLKGSRGEAAVYDAMERFANQDGCKVVPWQCCPVCNGSGQLYEPLSTGTFRPCPTCNGQRIIPMHVTQPQP